MPDDVLAELTSDAGGCQWTERWLEAITTPPTSKHRVHVAVGRRATRSLGFAAAGPATDEDLWPATDGSCTSCTCCRTLTGQGHDGRLLNAVADTFAEDGFQHGYTWALSGDDGAARRSSRRPAGRRTAASNLDMGVRVHVVRLHTRLSPEPG